MSADHEHKDDKDDKHAVHLPPDAVEALRTAMVLTDTPSDWYDDLAWIVMQESEGIVGSRSAVGSGAGLFQLTDVHQHLMPHGADSIGDAQEECVGGIRYIMQRYAIDDKAKTTPAAKAKAYWKEHRSY